MITYRLPYFLASTHAVTCKSRMSKFKTLEYTMWTSSAGSAYTWSLTCYLTSALQSQSQITCE
jgi:hypothetical protein